MPRYIDIDTISDDYIQGFTANADTYLVVRKILRSAPTVDVVEVVRCKDCNHYYDGRCYIANRSPLFKYDVNIHSCKEDDFCSYGERKGI